MMTKEDGSSELGVRGPKFVDSRLSNGDEDRGQTSAVRDQPKALSRVEGMSEVLVEG